MGHCPHFLSFKLSSYSSTADMHLITINSDFLNWPSFVKMLVSESQKSSILQCQF